jgi:pyrroline-5-carboxylate reductase
MTSLPGRTWFVGCGNMAGAMVEGWQKAGLDFSQAMAVRPSGQPVEGVRTLNALPDEPPPALVMLGFKPQKLDEVAPGLAPKLGPDTVVISILAGVEAASLRQRFPHAAAIVRAMPNLPVSEGRGVVALYSEDADASLRERLSELFWPLGRAHWAPDEREFAAIGSLAGAGPAYVARFIAALAKAGEARGLAPGIAQAIALETVAGTALMAEARGEAMDEVARRVASPKGTTEAGLAVLDADATLDRLIAETIAAAAQRGAELAEEARKP